MNALDDRRLDDKSFSWRDLLGQDKWDSFTPAFTSLTAVGATTFTGRYRLVGRQCFFEVSLSAATSVASTAGTTYMSLPTKARGIAGMAVMTDQNANTAVGTCHIDVANSRCWLPSQSASAHVFNLAGWFEL